MTRQRGQVQLEQSDMRLALNMAKRAKQGFSPAAIEETQQLIKIPPAKVREEKKRGVVFPRHNNVKAGLERHPALVQENQMDCRLLCQNATAKNPHTRLRRNGTGGTPPQPAPQRPGMPPAPPVDSERAQSSETECVPPGYVYIHTPLSSAGFFNLDPYGKDRMGDKDFIPGLLTDEGSSAG